MTGARPRPLQRPAWRLAALLVALASAPALARESLAGDFVNFESPQVHPLALSPDHRTLWATNTDDARVSVFHVADDGSLQLEAEVPVGVEPSSIAVDASEAWVTNRVSDSVSVVDAATHRVVATLHPGDAPGDVAFAAGKAFVALSGAHDQVVVYDRGTYAEVARLEVFGEHPRALAASADEREVYLVVLNSGNRTTTVGAQRVASGGGMPPPTPAKAGGLPPAPAVGLITTFDDAKQAWVDETGKAWIDASEYTLPDHDVFVLDTQSLSITRTIEGVGTTLFDVAPRPGSTHLWIPNTEARNAVRFEPNLRGHFVDTRMAVVDAGSGATQQLPLNPHVDYAVSPGPAAESAQSIAIPTDLEFSADGSTCWVAAFGSAAVASVDASSGATELLPVGNGPSGLALAEESRRLYVLERFDATVSTVDLDSGARIATTGLSGPSRFDPMPEPERAGRRLMYDAKATSGHGDAACASCHVFGDVDGIAWDLGDPTGQFLTYAVADWVRFFSAKPFRTGFHPMKGPMVTQTLRGLDGMAPYHWRGDRRDLGQFNGAFVSLLGRDAPLSASDMASLEAFLLGVQLPPNPNRTLDDGLPATIRVPSPGGPEAEVDGNPGRGAELYVLGTDDQGSLKCTGCHPLPSGTNTAIIPTTIESQDMKVAQFRNVYDKTGFRRFVLGDSGNIGQREQKSGFGVLHSGSTSLQEFLFAYFLGKPVDLVVDMSAFVLAFPSGNAPVVGHQLTVTRDTARSPDTDAELAVMYDQAAAGKCDVIAKGTVAGEERGYVLQPGDDTFLGDRTGEAAIADTDLRSMLEASDVLTFTGVPPGSGVRMGIDRDRDTWLDGDEVASGSDPSDPGLVPTPCSAEAAPSIAGLGLQVATAAATARTFSARGSVDLAGRLDASLDVAATGIVLDLRDAAGNTLLHRWIPPGQWTGLAGQWKYRDRSASRSPGIGRAVVRVQGTTVSFDVRGSAVVPALPDSAFPLQLTVVFGTAAEDAAGQCGTRAVGANACRLRKGIAACR